MNVLTESSDGATLGLVITVVLSNISIIHFESREISRELNGRTRTATLTDDIFAQNSTRVTLYTKSLYNNRALDVLVPICGCSAVSIMNRD